MHYWTGAVYTTLCGQSLIRAERDEELNPKHLEGWYTWHMGHVGPILDTQATGIDKFVSCGVCKENLRVYREQFPQAHPDALVGGRR